MTLVILLPISMTSDVPLPAAKLRRVGVDSTFVLVANRVRHSRTQNSSVSDVESGDLELFEHDLSHSLSILRGVPRRLSDNNRMVGRVDLHLVYECMRYYLGYCGEVVDYGDIGDVFSDELGWYSVAATH